MNVELVRVVTADGVRLEGSLRLPESPETGRLPVDIVIFHHGVGGNFYNQSFFEPMSDAFLQLGCAVLRANNRGHDLAFNSPAGRLGAAFETVDDCRHDWTAWTDFAASRGFGKIGLWGQSLGAVKTIYSLATEGDTRIARAITTSPPRFSYSAYKAREDGAAFLAYYEQAERLVSAGQPDSLFAADLPTSLIATARTYVDKYGPAERYDVLKHLPNVKTPLLLTIGGEEGIYQDKADRFAFGGLAAKVSSLASDLPNVTFELIEGADHAYTNRTDRLWTTVERWLSGDRVI
jgi:alpha-beta hydrolase superfamily lysophospholipase